MKTLIWPVAMYGYESWVLKKEKRCIETIENKCTRKLLWIPWMDKGLPYRMANCKSLNHIKTHKLWYFGHNMRNSKDTTEESMMTGLEDGTRNHGRPKISCIANITKWSGLSGYEIQCAVQKSCTADNHIAMMPSDILCHDKVFCDCLGEQHL